MSTPSVFLHGMILGQRDKVTNGLVRYVAINVGLGMINFESGRGLF